MTTLVARKQRTIEGKSYAHGAEIPPGLLSDDAVASMLDAQQLTEYDSSERRSLYRLFPSFSDCKEQEELTQEELNELCLP
jgi:hypothetical protein